MNNAKPGDIVVHKERAGNPENDKIRRATYYKTEEQLHGKQQIAWVLCIRVEDGCHVHVHPNDVIRIDPTQHGWFG